MKKGKGNTKVNEKRVEEKIVEETEVEEIKVEETKVSKKHKIYLSFGNRLVLNIVLLLVFVCLFICSFTLAFKITKKEYINIKENSNIDYKIVLKDNNFYEDNYLDQGMVYVASSIDKINVDYAYNFYVDKKSDLDEKLAAGSWEIN